MPLSAAFHSGVGTLAACGSRDGVRRGRVGEVLLVNLTRWVGGRDTHTHTQIQTRAHTHRDLRASTLTLMRCFLMVPPRGFLFLHFVVVVP